MIQFTRSGDFTNLEPMPSRLRQPRVNSHCSRERRLRVGAACLMSSSSSVGDMEAMDRSRVVSCGWDCVVT